MSDETVYLPSPNEPAVRAYVAQAWVGLRAQQRPVMGVLSCLAGAFITAVIWEQLYGRLGGQLPWLADAALAAALGGAVGGAMRTGKVVDKHWSVLAALLGALAATAGDMGGVVRRVITELDLAGHAEAWQAVGGLEGLIQMRSPLDWFVVALAGSTSGLASRPWGDEAAVVREAQLRALTDEEAQARRGDEEE